MKRIPDGLVGCKYGHRHLNAGAAGRCEEATFWRLCDEAGLDYKAERERILNTLPAHTLAEQIEAFPELIRPNTGRGRG